MAGDQEDAKKQAVLELDEPTEDAVPRPTIKTSFDLVQYAEANVPPMRERVSTLSDEDATEQARIASVLIDSTPPKPSSAPSHDAGAIRARLAPLSRVPSLITKSIAELGSLVDDPKSAYVLGFVDGVLSLETIVDVTGLPEAETVRILERFISQGAVRFK
jgi:hypothetical protein